MEKKVESVTGFISWASKSPQMVTAARKFKRCLLLGRKAITNLDIVLKSRDIALPTNVHIVKAMVFPVVMYRCVMLKKAFEHHLNSKQIKPVNPKGNES